MSTKVKITFKIITDKSVYDDVSDKVVKYFNASEPAQQSSPEVAGASAGSGHPETPRPVPRSRGTADAKLVLSVYGMNYTAIDTALHRVEQLCKDAEKTNVVHHPDVSKLTPDQVTKLDKYVDPVPTCYATVRLELRNGNLTVTLPFDLFN